MSSVAYRASCITDQWFTPLPIIDMVHSVLGGIDLDPASSSVANERVKATKYFNEIDDGLLQEWTGQTIFINPPGSKAQGQQKLPARFWQKLMASRRSIQHAIFLGYSIEQLRTTQNKGCESMLDFPLCVPAKRLDFYSVKEKNNAPTQSNVIVYVPGNKDVRDRFRTVFSAIGACT